MIYLKLILFASSVTLFLSSLAGLGFFIGFGYVSEQNHYKSEQCGFENCNSTATVCGTSSNNGLSNTKVCVESTMTLYLLSEKRYRVENYTVETTLYVCNLDILVHPYPCEQILGGSIVTCYYDDRRINETLRLYKGYYVPGGYIAGLIILPQLVAVSFLLLIASMCYQIC